MIPKTSMVELLTHMDISVHSAIHSAIDRNHATAVVLFRNQQLDSSALGDSSVLCVGPTCTYPTVESLEGKWLGDLPSQRKYPVMYANVGEE